jgi:glycine cleavage system H protein
MSASYPDDLQYTVEHEWARVREEIARIGITRFAVDQLGDVTMVELPEEGDEVEKGEVFGTVESVKAVSDLYAPVSGRVVKVNTDLADAPENVNSDPYEEGWLIEIEMSDPAEADRLMSSDDYEKFVAEQDQ